MELCSKEKMINNSKYVFALLTALQTLSELHDVVTCDGFTSQVSLSGVSCGILSS